MDIKIIKELKKPLDSKNIKELDGNSYLEGWFVIAEANRIFGFDGWSYETVYNREVCRTERKVGKKQYDGYEVGYEAKVRVQVDGVFREGTGHGSGIAQNLFKCIEGAAKEAETDAIKRTLKSFGYAFGLALYDKEKKNVGNVDEYDKEQAKLDVVYDKIKTLLSNADKDTAGKAWADNAVDITSIKRGNKDNYDNLLKEFTEAKKRDASS